MPSGSNAMAVTAILINKPVMYIVFGILLGIKGWCFVGEAEKEIAQLRKMLIDDQIKQFTVKETLIIF
jgi:hypothetical protein